MAGVINMLTSVQTAELSVVRRGANGKRFALTKSEDPGMNFSELLKNVLDTPAEGEAQLIETLKSAGADEDAINVAVANFRVQSGFKDKLSEEQFSAVAKAAGFDVEKVRDKKREDEDEEDPRRPGFFRSGKRMPTAKSHTPADMPAETRKTFDEQNASIELLRKEAAADKAEVVSLKKEAERKEYITKCTKEYSHVPGQSAEDMGKMLQEAYDVSKGFGEQLEKQWKETSTALKASALLKAQGMTHSPSDSSSAMGQLETIAKEFIAKDPKMSKDIAISKALEARPDLYPEYLAENPAQTGQR